jgi:hypothetical protein
VQDESLMHRTDILPLLQRQQPTWCLGRIRRATRSRLCTRTMLFLPRRRQKVLGGGEISPPWSNLLGADRTWCYVIMTKRHQPTAPGAETIQTESSNHEQINDMVSAPGGVGWCRCNFLWGTQQKWMLLAMAGSWWENGWFGINFRTQTSTKIRYHWKALIKAFWLV